MKLGGEVAMEHVTLDGVRALRTMITKTVHDVLYYMSPVYCQDIIDSVLFYTLKCCLVLLLVLGLVVV